MWILTGVTVLAMFLYTTTSSQILVGENCSGEPKFGEAFIFVTALIFGQTKDPKLFRSGSFRYLTGLFLLVCFILTKGYGGALISFLTIPLIPPPLNTMEDVALVSTVGDRL